MTDWSEDDHPRDEAGRFASGSYSGAATEDYVGSGSSPEATLAEWQAGDIGAYHLMRDPSTPEGQHFEQVLSTLPVYQGTVYRGMSLSDSELSGMTKGSVLQIDKHSSSAVDKEIANDFMSKNSGRAVFLEIQTRSGRVLPEDSQTEVVLPAGRRYRVVARNSFVHPEYSSLGKITKVVLKEE